MICDSLPTIYRRHGQARKLVVEEWDTGEIDRPSKLAQGHH